MAALDEKVSFWPSLRWPSFDLLLTTQTPPSLRWQGSFLLYRTNVAIVVMAALDEGEFLAIVAMA